MSSFEWIEQQSHLSYSEEMRLTLKEQQNSLRAKRRTLDLHIDRLMHEIQKAERERDEICRKEDAVTDMLDRRKVL